jgi:frataxin-like iron-binding protein CyaY
MELQGTVLKVYQLKSSPCIMSSYYLPTITPYYQDSIKYTPLVDLSLAHAQVEAAVDYTKKPNVFRVKTANGPQILFQVQTSAAALLWIEKISAGKLWFKQPCDTCISVNVCD